jgi:hypothetical protein
MIRTCLASFLLKRSFIGFHSPFLSFGKWAGDVLLCVLVMVDVELYVTSQLGGLVTFMILPCGLATSLYGIACEMLCDLLNICIVWNILIVCNII